jgi:hypothetical protein
MEQLINSLPILLRNSDGAEELSEAAAIAAWNHVAGEALRRNAVPVRLHEKTLSVAVTDPVWQRQLVSMSGQLLQALNSLLGQNVIRFLDFRVDSNAVQGERQKRVQAAQRAGAAGTTDGPIPFELLSAAASIHDHKLRKAFLGAAMSCAKRLEEGPTSSDLRSEF